MSTMDHQPFTIKYSRSASMTISNDRKAVQGVSGSHDVDHTVSMAPVPTSAPAISGEPNSTPISVTALVIGLAAAAFFLLMVAYVIYKVHWKNRNNPKQVRSKIPHMSFGKQQAAEIPIERNTDGLTSVASNLSNLWRAARPHRTGEARFPSEETCPGIHVVDLNSHGESESAADTIVSNPRLTAARFISSGQ